MSVTRVLLGVAALIKLVDAVQLVGRLSAPGALRLPYVPVAGSWAFSASDVVLLVWGVAGVAFLCNWRARYAGMLLAACMAAILIADQQLYSNHLYLLTLLVGLTSLALPRHRGETRGSWWPVFLLRCQLTIVYGFAAVAKLNPEYLSGAILLRNLARSGWWHVPESWYRFELIASMAIAALLLEMFLAVAFWSPRWRSVAAASGIVMHVCMIGLMTRQEGWRFLVFALAMWSVYPLFFAAASETSDGDRETLRGGLRTGTDDLVPASV